MKESIMSQDDSYKPTPPTIPIKFTGTGKEYFKIWIVNLLLSVLTLGIYSAWAKVRTRRYFYGNTSLAGSAFEYHAQPMAILKGRFIAVAALVLYVLVNQFVPVAGIGLAVVLALLTPWAIWRSIQFNARMTSYRNVRFGFGGSVKKAYKYLFFIPLLPFLVAAVIAGILLLMGKKPDVDVIISLAMFALFVTYFMFPYLQKVITHFYVNNHQYGQGKFSAKLSTGEYYISYLLLIAWTSLIYLVASVAIAIVMLVIGLLGSGFDLETMLESSGRDAGGILIIASVAVMYLVFIGIGIWSKAFLKARLRNYVYSNTALDDVMQLESSLSVGKLFGIMFTNALMIAATLGLAYPWAKVRLLRYYTDSTRATITGNVAQYVNQQQQKQSALGDELGEAFDLDLGLAV
jgi:uncharacterized membrane protein YjgN (DUF898 family)